MAPDNLLNITLNGKKASVNFAGKRVDCSDRRRQTTWIYLFDNINIV
jgi:hypothetical protein